jgi:hypothetical protein
MLASASLRVALFAALAFGSLGLKAAAGPARDNQLNSDPNRFERSATSILQAQGFATDRRTFRYRSAMIIAARGDCRIVARNATWGSAISEVYAQDVRDIGPVSYLYRGHRYSAPPGLTVRLGRLEFEILDRLGARPNLHLLTALAASPSCGDSEFGLSDVTIAT